jgi:hypothetical protein
LSTSAVFIDCSLYNTTHGLLCPHLLSLSTALHPILPKVYFVHVCSFYPLLHILDAQLAQLALLPAGLDRLLTSQKQVRPSSIRQWGSLSI